MAWAGSRGEGGEGGTRGGGGRLGLQQPAGNAAAGEHWSRLLGGAFFSHRVTQIIPSSHPSEDGGMHIPRIFTVPAL